MIADLTFNQCFFFSFSLLIHIIYQNLSIYAGKNKDIMAEMLISFDSLNIPAFQFNLYKPNIILI